MSDLFTMLRIASRALEAQLLKAAAEAAAGDPAVRADLVEKMRALLADGKIGTDADSLADSLIDDVLKNQ